jgi:hypothetical protein
MTRKAAPAKKAQKPVSEFYVVRTIQRATDTTASFIKGTNEKYVKKTFESGKFFVEDVSKGTYEALGGVIEDSRKFITRIPAVEKIVSGIGAEGQEHVVVRTFKKARKNTSTALKSTNEIIKDYNEKYMKKYIETGKLFAGEFGKNARVAIDGVVADGLKVRDMVTGAVDLKVVKALGAVTAKANLPTKDDLKKLTTAIESFNKKVESLVKQAK